MEAKNHKKKILFRADGNSEIGLGHVYRCLALIEKLNGHFLCYFAITDPSEELKLLIRQNAILIALPLFENQKAETEYLVQELFPKFDFSILTLDGYHFDTGYQQELKQNSSVKLVCIDDEQAFHYVSDVVINHAGGVEAKQISCEPYTRICTGFDYLMLRKEFLDHASKARHIDEVKSVFVCFGGADPADITGKLLDLILQADFKKIHLVVGSSYLNLEKLKKLTASHPEIDLYQHIDATKMVELMEDSELAIVPASTISLEAYCMKLILLSGKTAENQELIYRGLIQKETVFGLGDFSRLDSEDFLKKINEIKDSFINCIIPEESEASHLLIPLYLSL